MKLIRGLERWFDIRPHEIRIVVLSFFGAFLILSFMIVGRSLREALYLTSFDIKTLPYITGTVAILGLPTIGLFTRLLARQSARVVLRQLLLVLGVGLALLWPFLKESRIAVVAFYLWTSLGALVVTSGFWVVTSEYFPLRSAKRLFGLISAGGTTGAMIAGTSLKMITQKIPVFWLVPGLIALLSLFFLILFLLPRLEEQRKEAEERPSLRENVSLIWKNSHLRTLGWIVMTATLATTLLDYQFKELVRNQLNTKEALTGFFGAFYGWTGAASLVIQLFAASRLIAGAGIGWALSILPFILLLGSAAFFVLPGLWLVTAVRGADNSLRKSLHRSVLEVLFVPLPSSLRRRTKTLIDSVLDSAAEAVGSGLIFLWVTWANFRSIYLSLFIAGLAGIFISLSRKMDRQYFKTVLERLKEGETGEWIGKERFLGRDLLSVTMGLDLTRELKRHGLELPPATEVPRQAVTERRPAPLPEHLPDLIQLLARDSLHDQVTDLLVRTGEKSVPFLAQWLKEEKEDFVIRRRIPRVLARIDSAEADRALIEALLARRFEVRYRTAIALVRRRREGMKIGRDDWKEEIWKAIRFEVSRQKPVWEMQRVLDEKEVAEGERDEFIERHVGMRGELSLEHTFRMLALVLEAGPVRTAFRGIVGNDEKLKSISLEYLEQTLPSDVREKLWPFIGDIGEYQKERSKRPLAEVVDDLIKTGATLFQSDEEKELLRKFLKPEKS